MIYRSNLSAPDLSKHFVLRHPAKQMLGGHDGPSDPDFEPECTYFTHDEAAILFNIAKQIQGLWIDVGARFGWTGAHLIAAGCRVNLIDPDQRIEARQRRLESNLSSFWPGVNDISHLPFQEWSLLNRVTGCDGVVIDGNHTAPEPLHDAIRAHGICADDAVIVLHDFQGIPVQQAVTCLMDAGYRCRIYDTPNGVALCWRGLPDFVAPVHESDPAIDWRSVRHRCAGFDFTRCE